MAEPETIYIWMKEKISNKLSVADQVEQKTPAVITGAFFWLHKKSEVKLRMKVDCCFGL